MAKASPRRSGDELAGVAFVMGVSGVNLKDEREIAPARTIKGVS
ncbi:hypothetical protein [Pseudodesulfovibrio sp.]|nr:hypothetical protein [Pseudodesulfovibrio sp.]MDD3312535.1 hypothetical protein [Pseudodesulfovibrio sp.]